MESAEQTHLAMRVCHAQNGVAFRWFPVPFRSGNALEIGGAVNNFTMRKKLSAHYSSVDINLVDIQST
jgi:hypothetical protein